MTRSLRLLCTFLTILLAIPAMQARACAPAPVVAHHGPHGGAHAHHAMGDAAMTPGQADHQTPSPASARHDCIGCIAPIDRDHYRPDGAPLAVVTRHAGPTDLPYRLYRAGAPEPPPPRHPA